MVRIRRIRKKITKQRLVGAGLVAGGGAAIIASEGLFALPAAAIGAGGIFKGLDIIKRGKPTKKRGR